MRDIDDGGRSVIAQGSSIIIVIIIALARAEEMCYYGGECGMVMDDAKGDDEYDTSAFDACGVFE